MKDPTIILVDDHPMFRRGLRHVIEENEGFKIIEEADDGERAWACIEKQSPDLVISDLEMPKLDGLNLTRRIHEQGLRIPVVILTMHNSEDMFHEAMEAGAKGYVLKETAHHDIVPCLQTVLDGRRFISPSISDFLFLRRDRASALKKQKTGLNALTPAETLILKLISRDRTTKEIAAELGVSPHTVTNHRANICTKLELQGSHSLLKFAFDNKHLL